jgi:hypothetical protein
MKPLKRKEAIVSVTLCASVPSRDGMRGDGVMFARRYWQIVQQYKTIKSIQID